MVRTWTILGLEFLDILLFLYEYFVYSLKYTHNGNINLKFLTYLTQKLDLCI